MQLDFIKFTLPGTQGQCDNDYIEIYDTIVDRINPIRTLCGRYTPSTVTTIGNKMNIKLFGTKSSDGFEAEYSLPDCGGYQSGAKGTVGFQARNPYHMEEHCHYIIQATKHHSIKFNFDDDFNVPCKTSNGQYVSGDYIEVLEYSSEGLC